jgi:hypothetical protein
MKLEKSMAKSFSLQKQGLTPTMYMKEVEEKEV